MRLVAGLGVPERRLDEIGSLRVGQALCSHVASTGLPFLADMARIEREEAAAFLRSVGARAYTRHPILGQDGEMLGTFSLASTGRDYFAEVDIVFFRAACDVIAPAWQRRRAEATLRESETRFRALVEASAEAVWTCGAEGATHEPSPSWCALTGQSQAEWLGWGWLGAVHPEDRESMIAHRRRCLAERRPYVTEYRLRHRSGGYRWTQARATPLLAEDGSVTGWIGMNADITGRREARAVLERSHEELERLVEARTRDLEDTQRRLAHTERMQALGQLAGGVAHDFNNVLQAVQDGASLIQRRAEETEGVRRHAHLILDAASRGAAITRRLLSFSRRGNLRTEPVNPLDLLAGMREGLTHTLGTGIGIRVEAQPGLPPLAADKAQLETVLVNLATNARDAMEGSGTLTLSAALDIRGRTGRSR
ncbi:PAS domain S-box protein [Roseomonas sp. GCM10028921]